MFPPLGDFHEKNSTVIKSNCEWDDLYEAKLPHPHWTLDSRPPSQISQPASFSLPWLGTWVKICWGE